VQTNNAGDDMEDMELSDEELMLTSTVVYGFSLSDKLWREFFHGFPSDFLTCLIDAVEFDVEKIQDVEWNNDAFANLVLPSSRKDLLRCLVEAHHRELGFDDFIKGKGHGLVINLFGPPGVGACFIPLPQSLYLTEIVFNRKNFLGGSDKRTRQAPSLRDWWWGPWDESG